MESGKAEMNREPRGKRSLLLHEFKPGVSIPITAAIMLGLIVLVYWFGIPNPNMILIAGLVICSAVFGYSGGAVAGLIMLLYTLFFFSTDNCFYRFTPENAAKVAVSLIGIVTDLVFVCELKRTEVNAFHKVSSLTEELSKENRMLFQASMTDTLTGLRNRLSLHYDYPAYENRPISVVMMDIDNFKTINDRLGHAEGDRVLRETGQKLIRQFSGQYCYRYGGDEFLIICPDLPENEVLSELRALMADRPQYMDGKRNARTGYSIGCVHGVEGTDYSLQDMMKIADERLYQAKNSGKNQIVFR